MNKIHKQLTSGYQKSFNKHGQSPKAMQWVSYRAAALRYRELVKGLDFQNKSVLDAGCGMGDLLPYIYAGSDNFDYMGVDVMPNFIEVAQKRYLGHNFQVANPFVGDLGNSKYDIVLSSGVMNANAEGWILKRQGMIKALFELTNETLVFNMAGAVEPPKFSGKSRVAYANANDIVDYCKTLSPNVSLNNTYHRSDFTITIKR